MARTVTPALPHRERAARIVRWTASAVAVAALIVALAIWYAARWTPPRAEYPIQGVLLSPGNGPIAWGSIKASGADFAYLDAIDGTRPQPHLGGRRLDADLAAARASGLRVGVVHRFTLCRLASEQADAFIRRVPRDPSLLPPAVWLRLDEDCAERRPTRALLLSELTTFLGQIEAHLGKPAIIAPDSAFDGEYEVSRAVNRTLWVRRNFFTPNYGAHPFVMWLANTHARIAGAHGTVGWIVVADTAP